MLALFAVSLVAGAPPLLWERRAPFPLLDLSYLRVPRFTTPNVVAYCTYFATFAIFFFTVLYLSVIAVQPRLPHRGLGPADDRDDDPWQRCWRADGQPRARRPLAAGRPLLVVRLGPAAD